MGKNKTVYINENALNGMFSAKISNTLPKDFYNLSGFPFTPNPAFPDIYENNFALHILEKEYERVKENILELGSIDTDDTDLKNALSKLSYEINQLEEPVRVRLEKAVSNYLITLFDIPDDFLEIGLEITNEIDGSESYIQLDPEESSLEYKEFKDAKRFKQEVLKRRVINMLISGAAYYYSSKSLDFLKNEGLADEKLIKLYKESSTLNDYLLMSSPKIKQTERDKKISGSVLVNLGSDVYLTEIEAKGENFQILVYEAVKGLMELFATHGLPKEKSMAQSVIMRTDYAKAEPWNMRMGNELWKYFIEEADFPESNKIPYIFMEVCKLPVNKFNRLMTEIFSRSGKGKRLMKNIIDDLQYYDFLEKMKKSNTEKDIIEDEFIHPEEL